MQTLAKIDFIHKQVIRPLFPLLLAGGGRAEGTQKKARACYTG